MKSLLSKLAGFGFVALAIPVAQAKMTFFCSNQPETTWQEYYVVQGIIENENQLKLDQYGIVEGSAAAQEMEPVNTVEGITVQHDSNLAASSAQWRNAKAFNLATAELGPATFLLHMDSIRDGASRTSRLKVQNKDLRLQCSFSSL